jgi:hypothetical protein
VDTESSAEGLEGVVASLPVQHARLVLRGEEPSDEIPYGDDGRSVKGRIRVMRSPVLMQLHDHPATV